jgi:hypothetical protein
MDRSFKTVQELNRYRKEVTTMVAQGAAVQPTPA